MTNNQYKKHELPKQTIEVIQKGQTTKTTHTNNEQTEQ